MHKIKLWLLAPFTWTVAIIFLIEEAIWDWSAALMARLGAIRLVHAVEARIAALPPRWALFTFLLPSITLIPAKIIALHTIASGHWLIGVAILGMAKLVGMALFSRIFNLTRPALMQLPWFAGLYATVMHYRDHIHTYLESWQAYQHIKQRIVALIASIKASFSLHK